MTEYRAASDSDVPALKNIWGASFDDPPEFIDDYYRARFRPEQTFVACEDTAPAAMLTALPLSLELSEGAARAAYIYAVATAPEHRGKGLSTALLDYAAGVLKGRGYDLAVLVPAEESLFGFYSARGYRPAAKIAGVRFAEGELAAGGAKLVPIDGAEYASLRDDAFSAPGYFRWDGGAVERAVAEAEFFDGGAFYFSTKTAEGAALCVPDGDELLIKELAMAEPEAEAALAAVGQLAASFGKRAASVRLPEGFPLAGRARDFAMYRPLSEELVLPEGAYFNLALD